MDNNTSSPSSAQIAAMSAKIMIATVIIVFLLMLFLFCIHVYFRCFYSPAYEDAHIVSWRRREARRSRTPAAAASQARRRGLDPQALRSIPIKVYNPKDFKEGLECAVCLSEVSEGEKTRILPKCNHGFHVQCIDMWFHSHSTCPLCRNPVVAPQNQPLSNGVEGIVVSSSSSTSSSDDEDSDLSYRSANEGQGMSEGSSSSSGDHHELVIEIPMRELIEEEEGKSPVVTRLKSFKRLLSRGKRALIPSPRASSSGDNASNDQV